MKTRIYWMIALVLGVFYALQVAVLRLFFDGIPRWGVGLVFVIGTVLSFIALAIGTCSDPGKED